MKWAARVASKAFFALALTAALLGFVCLVYAPAPPRAEGVARDES